MKKIMKVLFMFIMVFVFVTVATPAVHVQAAKSKEINIRASSFNYYKYLDVKKDKTLVINNVSSSGSSYITIYFKVGSWPYEHKSSQTLNISRTGQYRFKIDRFDYKIKIYNNDGQLEGNYYYE